MKSLAICAVLIHCGISAGRPDFESIYHRYHEYYAQYLRFRDNIHVQEIETVEDADRCLNELKQLNIQINLDLVCCRIAYTENKRVDFLRENLPKIQNVFVTIKARLNSKRWEILWLTECAPPILASNQEYLEGSSQGGYSEHPYTELESDSDDESFPSDDLPPDDLDADQPLIDNEW